MADAKQLVDQAVKIAGLNDYNGRFRELGGGEVNDTFRLEGTNGKYVLRVAKRPDLDTLLKESMALEHLDLVGVPKEVFFDPKQRIDDRMWILETAVGGATVERLSLVQLESLGKLLAGVHRVKDAGVTELQLWPQFLTTCRYFGDENKLLNHPDTRLRTAIQALQTRIQAVQPAFSQIEPRLTHGDVTLSNILADGESVGLIDWEFARFSDSMLEFSTIYYEDMDYNRGKWRIRITTEEKQALFKGYTEAGGELHEDRIDFWMNFDKVGAATYLYWKLHESGQQLDGSVREQNEYDFGQLLTSLKQYG